MSNDLTKKTIEHHMCLVIAVYTRYLNGETEAIKLLPGMLRRVADLMEENDDGQ